MEARGRRASVTMYDPARDAYTVSDETPPTARLAKHPGAHDRQDEPKDPNLSDQRSNPTPPKLDQDTSGCVVCFHYYCCYYYDLLCILISVNGPKNKACFDVVFQTLFRN